MARPCRASCRAPPQKNALPLWKMALALLDARAAGSLAWKAADLQLQAPRWAMESALGVGAAPALRAAGRGPQAMLQKPLALPALAPQGAGKGRQSAAPPLHDAGAAPWPQLWGALALPDLSDAGRGRESASPPLHDAGGAPWTQLRAALALPALSDSGKGREPAAPPLRDAGGSAWPQLWGAAARGLGAAPVALLAPRRANAPPMTPTQGALRPPGAGQL